jgi:hypothetical protein
MHHTIFIRRSEVIDKPVLRQLAMRDGSQLPRCTFLVAERKGEIVAAAPIEADGPTLVDPSRGIAGIALFVESQARRIRQTQSVPIATERAG